MSLLDPDTSAAAAADARLEGWSNGRAEHSYQAA